MLIKPRVLVLTLAASLVLVPSMFSQEKKPNWKDRAEYDLYESIIKDPTPATRLEKLDKWKSSYANTDFVGLRLQIYLATYRQLNRSREVFNTAKEILKTDPKNLEALSALAIYVYRFSPPAPADLDDAYAACNTILSNLDALYAPDKKTQPNMSDADWAKAKKEMQVWSQKTLGWIDWQKKNLDQAEVELAKALELDPTAAQVSYWLGNVLVAEKKPEKQSAVLYDFARAAAYDGPNALDAATRKQITDYLTRAYKSYHGSTDGLDQLMATAKTAALPPEGFKVESTADIERKKIEADEAAAKANPMLALWRNIKQELKSDTGQTYFNNSMKDAELPGGAGGVQEFKGKLISAKPETRPKELVLSVEDGTTADCTLKLDEALVGKMEPGAMIGFSGVAESFAKDPYMVTFNVEKTKVTGWAGKVERPVRKKSTATKKRATKKQP